MNGLKSLKLGLAGLAAGALLLAGGLLLVGQVSAISGSLSISDGTAAPGGQATVQLSSNVGGVGLGAWTVDISYDADQVSVVSCSPQQGGVCNPAFSADSVRITGASASGLIGNTTLGSITFECANSEGDSPLGLAVEVFADATIGAPADINETVNEGSVSCETPAPTAANTAVPATATPLPNLGPTGTGGGTGGGSDFSWLIASLAGLGVVALAGYSALRVRTRNS
jgi:hypothetical protein